ncbi:hypothetical protein M9A13_16390 [Acinetobacter baumannii]|uniref:hypothetical protein n=1 Tax=Acinetobacter baumannii TaxID=470 RepID=UPI0025A60C60|nr:hypothetical protein [Acinetobacter baumannii]MDM8497992.1 hypothetical protein [Acinetobacter baumannii]
MNIFEMLLKSIPFTPIFYWFFSEAFRLAKKRKFYDMQIDILNDYIQNYFNNTSIEFSLKDLKARQVSCNYKVGADILDFLIKNKCRDIFKAIQDFDQSLFYVKVINSDTEDCKLVSNFYKNRIILLRRLCWGIYFVTGGFLFFNYFILSMSEFLNKPPLFSNVENSPSLFLFLIILLIISSLGILTFGRWIDACISLSKKVPVIFKT